MALSEQTKEAIENAVEIASLKLDLKYTEKLDCFERTVLKKFGEIPGQVAAEILACEQRHREASRWGIRTFLTILPIVISAIALVYTVYGG